MSANYQTQTPQNKSYQQKKVNLESVVHTLFCQEHSDYYTNFCCNFECLKPLCPDCVSIHSKAHHKQNTLPQIESFKQIKNICSTKIKSLITHLKEQIDECEFRSIFDPDKMLTDAKKELDIQQEKIISYVKNYFEEQFEIYKRKLNENSLKSTEFKSVFDRFKKILEELEYLQDRIQYESSENFIRHIKQAFLLDQEKLLKTSSGDINKLLLKQQINQLEISVDDSGLNNLRKSLNQICAVQVQQIQPHLNATQHSQSSQKFIQLGSNQLQMDDMVINNSHQDILPFKKPISQLHTPMGGLQNKHNLNIESPQLYQLQQQANLTKKSNNPYDQQKTAQEFMVQQKDYFGDKTKLKFMHFFESGGKSLFLLDLNQSQKFMSFNQQQKLQFQEIKLNINFEIPKFHRSIITPNGEIYLTGGQYQDFTKSAFIFNYNYQEQSLQPAEENMLVARSSHAICYFEPYIIICGGMTKNQKTLSHCERFNTQNDEVTTMANLNFPCSSFCITPFKNRYIFKFGGLSEGQNQKQILNQIIEKYDFQLNKWEVIDPQIKINKINKNLIQKFKLNSEAGAIQINENNIFVFGGYSAEGPTNQSFLLNIQNQKYSIQNISDKDLPNSEGIWNNQTLILGGQLFALQNVANQSNELVLDDQKKVNSFDSNNWIVLN